ncbi:MAG: Wzz/FepE/Etk N-terminal domain-containing protein [Flavobacteriales bacterium]|jgi:capsular polysaccharide biosynthesis protein|nr:Wzz/FepE/Etk N-terminal domain-containing protein [Flavobacteriales bacterium]
MAEPSRSTKEESFDPLEFLWKGRRVLVGITLLGLIAGVVATLVITPRYRSEVILFPAITNSVSKALLSEQSTGRDDILALGDEEDAEQLLQILNSDVVRDRTSERFDLGKVYKIKADSEHRNSELRDAYEGHVKFQYTKFGSVSVEVLDAEPQRAADMANFMAAQVDSVWNDMAHERAFKGYNIVKEGVDKLTAEIAQIEDSMSVLRSLGVQDYHTQAERYNEYLGAAIVKGDQRAINAFEERFKVLAKYGGAYVTLQDRQFNEVKRLSALRLKLEQASADLHSDLPHKFTVNDAYPADRKSYPVWWLLIPGFTFAAFIMAVVLLAINQRISKIRMDHGR